MEGYERFYIKEVRLSIRSSAADFAPEHIFALLLAALPGYTFADLLGYAAALLAGDVTAILLRDAAAILFWHTAARLARHASAYVS